MNNEPLQELYEKPNYIFNPNEQHDWRQKGPYIVCKSCEIEHATYIGTGKIMVGLDEKGRPILKRVRDLYKG